MGWDDALFLVAARWFWKVFEVKVGRLCGGLLGLFVAFESI